MQKAHSTFLNSNVEKKDNMGIETDQTSKKNATNFYIVRYLTRLTQFPLVLWLGPQNYAWGPYPQSTSLWSKIQCCSSLVWNIWRIQKIHLIQTRQKVEVKLILRPQCATWRTGGWVNLNFLAPPYGVAFLNPWNMSKYPILSLNSKIDFKALKRAYFLSFFD